LPRTAPSLAAGEGHARALLGRFVGQRLRDYGVERNRPDLAATSGLSAALHFGEIHPRTVVAAALAEGGEEADAYVRQLCWRDFYADVLARQPEVVSSSVDGRWDSFAGWHTDERALQDFSAWCHGRTGYPFVDAGMRQLLHTGWMHYRARMVTASFLTKDLLIPWQWGAVWFARHLVDADVANNSLGWQWVAGSGMDPAQFSRIFNPVTQGQRFDPSGAYVRRHVPQLRALPAADVHEPWLHPGAAPDYPDRIVDHAAARAEALAAYATITRR
jgi:deoxyribodipyrimidine photo-lyase